ncbi:MAG: dATP/dGTP diphosphohydrolase domain-containing protein [Bacteroidales bacterium]
MDEINDFYNKLANVFEDMELNSLRNTLTIDAKPIGNKDDLDKLKWDLLPMDVIEDVVKVLTYGAKKYSDDNWKLIDNPINRYYSAMMRHLIDWKVYNEQNDKESGLPHLAHALCCLVFINWFSKHNKIEKVSTTTIVAI